MVRGFDATTAAVVAADIPASLSRARSYGGSVERHECDTRDHRGYVRRRGDGGAERARADLAKEQPNDGSDDDECHPLDAGSRRAAGRRDAAKVAKARNRAIHTMPVIVGFTIGCGLDAASEASAGLWSVVLPTGLALLAFAMGLADEHAP